jgi:hypothetical protein
MVERCARMSSEASERSRETMPVPPPDVVEAARLAPDHWISMVDPGWQGEGVPPAWAVVGRWRSGLDGEIEEWEDNEEHRPSPESLDWPEPVDEVDAALQLAVTGYGPADAVTDALATAEVAVLIRQEGTPVTAVAADGTPVMPVFTSTPHLEDAGGFAFELLTAGELLDRLPKDHALYLNPPSPAGAVVDAGFLAEAVTRRAAEDGADGSDHEGLADATATATGGTSVAEAIPGAEAPVHGDSGLDGMDGGPPEAGAGTGADDSSGVGAPEPYVPEPRRVTTIGGAVPPDVSTGLSDAPREVTDHKDTGGEPA